MGQWKPLCRLDRWTPQRGGSVQYPPKVEARSHPTLRRRTTRGGKERRVSGDFNDCTIHCFCRETPRPGHELGLKSYSARAYVLSLAEVTNTFSVVVHTALTFLNLLDGAITKVFSYFESVGVFVYRLPSYVTRKIRKSWLWRST